MSDPGGDFVVGVLGLGHVGLPTAVSFAELGWKVVGTDHDTEKVERISLGKSPFYEPGLEAMLQQHLESGHFRATPDVGEAIREAHILFICVGTPLNPDGSADLSQVEAAVRSIADNLNGYKLVVEKSTVPVLTASWIKRTLERFRCQIHGFDVASNPEFLREGAALHDCLHPDRVVVGVEANRAEELLRRLYQPLVDRGLPSERLIITDLNTAELIKHAANAFLALKISFINMVADLCDATGADVVDLARGIGLDPRIGPHFLQAGIGFGGYCLPKDLRAFIHVAQERNVDFSLLDVVERINRSRVELFIQKVKKALWVLKDKRLAIWGLSFKPQTDDIREAPSLHIVRGLLDEGARLRLFDPEAIEAFRQQVPPGEQVYYANDLYEAVHGTDALLLLTEWEEFLSADFAQIKQLMELPIIIDGRNVLDSQRLKSLGFEYHGMGRGV